jgi:uncharacterized membrane protein YbhN (UPF0104 family)
MLQKSKKYILLVLALLAAAYFIYKFRNAISLRGFQWSMVAESLRGARISLLLLALAAIYVCYAVRAVRWMRFCRALGTTHFGNVYSATLMGFTCVFLLGRPAEPIRPVLIARKDSLSVAKMFGVYVLERIFDVAATAVLAGYALLMFERGGIAGAAAENGPLMKVARSTGVALLAGLVVAVAFLVYFRTHGAGWLARKLEHESWRHGWREKVAVLLKGFSEGLQGIRTWNDLGALIAITAAHWVLVIFVYVWVLDAFGGQLAGTSFAAAALVAAFTLVGSAAQAPAIGGGSQAATFLVLTLIFGVEREPAAVASIVLWLISFAGCCLPGVPLLLREGWSVGELRRMAREEEKAGEAKLLVEAEHGADRQARPR